MSPAAARGPSWARAAVVAGSAVAALLVGELLVATLVVDSVLGLGLYPLLLWVLAFAGGVAGFAALDPLIAGAATRIGRPAGRFVTVWLVLVAMAVAIVLLHVHQTRVPGMVREIDRAVFKTIPGAIAVLALVWTVARRRGAARLASNGIIVMGLILLVAAMMTGWRPERTSEYRGVWPAGTAEMVPRAERATGTTSPDLLMVGLDGADWSYIEPIMTQGLMPNLERLVGSSVRGVLENDDIETYVSPVAWTNITTGTLPDRHGVRTWGSPPTALPRVWDMMAIAGGAREPLVMNLPGTFPVAGGPGFRTAGMAAPGVVVGTDQGALVTRDRAIGPARGPIAGSIQEDSSCSGGIRLTVPSDRFNVVEAPFRGTSPSIGLTILGTGLRSLTARSLQGLVEPALEVCAGFDEGTRTLRLAAGTPAEVRVRPGEWSPWLEFETAGDRTVTRIKNVTDETGEPSIFVGPLVILMVDGLVDPVTDLAGLDTSLPWLSPAADSIDFLHYQSSDLLESLNVEWVLDVEAGRVATALALLRERRWTDVAYVLGSTDRLHHIIVSQITGYTDAGNQGVYPGYAEVYARADRWLGRILQYAGPETVVLVVSDHGSSPGRGLRLNHGPEGIYVLSAPTLRGGSRGPRLGHEDVVPILLAHLGHPSAEDLDGVVPDELWPRGPDGERLVLPEPIPSYEPLFESATSDRDEEIDPRVREQLRALGYIQ